MEEYRRYNEEFEVSNLGSVRKNGEAAVIRKDEYYYYVLYNGQPIRVHTMVGKCFPEICGEPMLFGHYHHINHNQLDNRAENIRCISYSEHKKLHQVEDGVSVAVKAYDKKGNFVGRWDSMKQAAEETGASYRHIYSIVNEKERRFTAAKLFWFKEETTEEEVKERMTTPFQHKFSDKPKKKKRVKLTEEEKKERRKAYYQANKERIKKNSREYYYLKKKVRKKSLDDVPLARFL